MEAKLGAEDECAITPTLNARNTFCLNFLYKGGLDKSEITKLPTCARYPVDPGRF